MLGNKSPKKFGKRVRFIALVLFLLVVPEMGVEVLSDLLDHFIPTDIENISDFADRPINPEAWRKAKRRVLRILIWIRRKLK